jgi:subtilisin-like proprotein convertase family protein
MRKHSARTAVLAFACVASLGLIAGVAPAAAKKVKKRTVIQTATVNQCVNVGSPISSVNGPTATNPNNPQVGTANIPVTIPAYRGLPQFGTVTGVTLAGVRISHTFNADLNVLLVAPGARTVPLSMSRGGSGDGYGTGPASCAGSLVRFADTFGTPIASLAATDVNPITGDFKPERPLAGLNGGQAGGNWQFLVTDGASGDDGSLDAVQLTFTYTYLTEVKVKPKKKK